MACSARQHDPPEAADSPPVLIELGPAGFEAGLATIAVDEQGRALALIGSEDGGEQAVLVRCLDRLCAESARTVVPGDTEIVAFTSDGLPLLLIHDLLLRCDDVRCSSFAAAEIPGELSIGMTVRPDGNPIIAVAEEDGGARLQFSLLLCGDPMCESSEVAVLEHGASGFEYPGQLALLPGGEPILFYSGLHVERALVVATLNAAVSKYLTCSRQASHRASRSTQISRCAAWSLRHLSCGCG